MKIAWVLRHHSIATSVAVPITADAAVEHSMRPGAISF